MPSGRPDFLSVNPIVFLPATAPDNFQYGTMPVAVPGVPANRLHHVRFPRQVWYNRQVRAAAIAQIKALNVGPVVLVGFSKSGNGALGIALDQPDLVSGLLIFDAPVCHSELPPWETVDFYTPATWRPDLPANRISELKCWFNGPRRLVLVSGANFSDDMTAFAALLGGALPQLRFIVNPTRAHHWNSGWVEDFLPLFA